MNKPPIWIALLLCFCATLSAQNLIVRGKVVSADKKLPLYGVNIQIKGTTTGTLTDNSGQYELKIKQSFFNPSSKPSVLVFSYTGFRTMEVEVNDRSRIDVALSEEASELEEVVVTGTAIGRSPKNMSYAVGRINREELALVPAPNIGLGLQGKSPGLRVLQSGGQPGQGPYFQIRSATSIANGQQPLILVDGTILNGSSLADFNAEDIDRVEILKGSAGTSYYGSQAANGVIQIFTKRGKDLAVGETKVIYRGEIGSAQAINQYPINTFTNREIVDPSGPQPILGAPTSENIHNAELPNLQNYQESILFQNGTYQSNYLSVQGKSSTTNFLASAQRLREEGIIQRNDGYTRNSFRLNLDHRISSKFDIQASSMFSTSKQDLLTTNTNGPTSYLASTLFLTPMFDLTAENEEDGSIYDWDIDNTSMGITNPLYQEENSSQTVDRSRTLGSLRANYYAKDWLKISYMAAIDRSNNQYEHYVDKGYLSTTIPGFFGPLASANTPGSNGGGIYRSQRINTAITSRLTFTAQKKLGGFNTAFRGSFLYEDLTQDFNESRGEDLAVSGLRSLDNAKSNISIASEFQEVVAYSYFGIADVDYKNKYLFSGLFRREGSSLFGSEERWANYYRLSGGYRLTEDVRIKGFQEIKLRASIGTSGIRPTFEQRFETFQLLNGVATRNTLGNTLLKPAYSTEMEIGLDARFLKAFRLEFNYAQVTTEDQILLVPLSGAAGFSGQWQNAGTLEATVYEAGLNIDLKQLLKIRVKDFHWNVHTTFDRVEQRISSLAVPAYVTGPGLQQANLFLIEQDQAFGTMIGEVFATNLEQLADMENIDADNYTINELGYVVEKASLGTAEELPVKLVDANGNPVVQSIGDINPDFRMGFAHTLGYKGFRLYALVDWKKGGAIYNLTKQWLYRDQRHADVSANSTIAASFYGDAGLYNGLVPNNHFVEDGSFVMIREASLSYTFGKDKMGGFLGGALNDLTLSIIGRNLFTFTNYSGFHPDITSMARGENTLSNRVSGAPGSDPRTPYGDPALFMVDAFNYPLARTVSFSLQMTF